ncbi:hypothetical protein PQX77_012355 [Marasmius sp. AFHP31]|nr:hypothetical protein PQX77_012355 [Marasmius sp. AFHP31]
MDVDEDWHDHEADLAYYEAEGPSVESEETDWILNSWNPAPYCSRSYTPEIDDILVEHHLSIMAPNRVMSLNAYLRLQQQSGMPISPPTTNPWAPFHSWMDFDVVDFALQAQLNKNLTNLLLKLIKRIAKGETVSFKNHKDVCDAWESASHISTPFEKEEIAATFKPASGEKTYNLLCYVRDTWKWTQDLLEDPLVKGRFNWDAQRLYRWDGRRWERFVTSPWTVDRFWEIQSALPAGRKPLTYIVYSDKTRLSSFGTATGYPVITRIANIDDAVRNSNINVGGGGVIGWVDTVSGS